MSRRAKGLEAAELHAHLAAVVESSSDAIVSTDLGGIILSWNQGATALFGRRHDEALGRPVSALIGGPLAEVSSLVERLRAGHRIDHPRTRLGTEGDRSVVVSLGISPVHDVEGGLTGLSIMAREVEGVEPAHSPADGELRMSKRVQEMSGRLIPAGDSGALYRELIEVAIDVTGANRGTLHALDEESGELTLLETVGLGAEMTERIARVRPEDRTSCAQALEEGGRVIVDYAKDERVAGTPEARAHLEAGVRAAQSTPLLARSGRLLGMLTTYWDAARELSEGQGALLDILARQAADVIERSQAGSALRDSERRERFHGEQLETLLDQAPMGLYLVDADFRLRRANPLAEAVFAGVPDHIGRDFGEVLRTLWGEERGDEVGRMFRHTLETGEPHHFPEFAVLRGDLGVTEYYDWRIARIALPEGRPGVVCYFQEISDQVRARLAIAESEQLYRALFETMGEGFCILQLIFDDQDDPVDYRYVETNPAFEQHTGLSGAVGRTVRELVPDIEPFWFDIYGRVAMTGESTRFVNQAQAMQRWFEIEAFRIGRAEERKVAVLFADITARKEAEAERAALVSEIERQRRLYDAIVSATPDLIYVFDLDYRFKFANKAILEMWGRTLDESLGRGLRELGYEDWHAEMHEREIDQVVTTKRPVRGDVSFPHATLGRRIYDYIFVPVVDEAGRVEAVAGTTRDVTDREQSERALMDSQERLLLAKAAAHLGIHDFDVASGVVSWDQRTREIWGVGPDEPITYEVWLEGIHSDDRMLAEDAVQRSLDPDEDVDYAAEYRVVHRGSGEVRWVQVTGQVTFLNDEPVRLVGTVQDITERKLTEEALKEANRRKDEFLATLSHELRNPLAAIRTGIAVLHSDTDVPARARRMATLIDRQSAQLVRLIDDLLDVSRISRGIVKLERSPTDLGRLMTKAVADAAAASTEEGLELQVAAPTHAVLADVDPVRVAQVFQNLLHNARKFTPSGGTIEVAVERDDGEAVVRIVDSGIGMRQDDLTRVFDMFTQVAGPLNEQTQGLGIGLALARSIVDLHGGSIQARSEGPGKGSEFIVRLPLARETADPDVSEEQGDPGGGRSKQPGSGSGLRILAAEDNEDVLATLALLLRMSGHEVETAVNGREALEKMRSYRPDVGLLDIGMPGMNGYEVAKEVRREAWAADILLIAMTGWGREEDKRQAIEAGFDTHLTKPVEIGVLESKLESAYKPPSSQGPQRA